MLEHGSLRDPILINTIGHTAGVLLFGLIIILLIRDWRIHGMRQIKLSLIAALLALGWNIGSLIALALPYSDSLAMAIVIMASFSVLSLLPAILFQVALQGQSRYMVTGGYIVSICAVALHFYELFFPNIHLHQAALVSIVIGFGVLTVAAFFLRYNAGPTSVTEKLEWISLACLALFTTSFLHFGYQHVSSPWAAEIAWHHIGIPVALIVLLRDYRFLLLDAFLRFLVNSGLAAIYVTTVLVLNEKLRLWDLIRERMFATGLALVALCLSLILFAYLRNAAQSWVSRVIFRRQSVDESVRTIVKLSVSVGSEEELLVRAAQQVARHLWTERCAVVTAREDEERLDSPSVTPREQGRNTSPSSHFAAEARIPLRFSSGDARFLVVGSRQGGRRYLSEDLGDMRQLASAIVEQVERFRAEELKRLVSQAELRALQAQINPHFLFNALNTLYGTIDRRSHDARRMVLNLADIFRYFLQGDRTVIPLSEELRIVEAYLEIEALRLGDRLETELVVTESAKSTMIPILSIQPLVENAVKHGIAAKAGGGRVSVRADKDTVGLRITVEDTGIGFEKAALDRQKDRAGVGLENVRRRLALCYGSAADMQIQSGPGGTTVTFLVPDPDQKGQLASQIEVEA
ncbi:MAG TPA: histidine kinase [Bryobacteraceae bacterium]|jgi:hypothetical protein|nr:histidine kinase [Bryobacteraceae bacterium]